MSKPSPKEIQETQEVLESFGPIGKEADQGARGTIATCTPNQFKLFRMIFGLYLIWHFYSLIGYGPELFGRTGMIPDPYMNPTWTTWSYFIPKFMLPETDAGILGFLHVMVQCSIFFAIGISQTLNSLILWYGWAFLFNRNNLIANPGLPYVGWLLLASTIIPNPGIFKIPLIPLGRLKLLTYTHFSPPKLTKAELLHLKKKQPKKKKMKISGDDDIDIDDKLLKKEEKESDTEIDEKNEGNEGSEGIEGWEIPPLIFWGAWFLMALGYMISGIHKLQCQSWRDGSALSHVLESLLARDNDAVKVTLRFMKAYPFFMKLISWGSLVLEISFLPLGIFDRLRFPYWFAFMVMHIGILGLIDFTDLTVGVMMIHLFTFDGRWLNL